MTAFPVIAYRDAQAAVAWLRDAFGAEPHMVHEEDGVVVHAELKLGDGLVMASQARDGSPFAAHTGTTVLYVVVDDPDAHHDRAVAAGAEVVLPLTDQDYGSREYAARDLDGNVWSFGTYRPG